jgi:rare lipoprotein A (peptidoglycan hydrolase)
LRRFGVFCAAVLLLFAVIGVAAIKAARAEIATWYRDGQRGVATWYGEDSESVFVDRLDPNACADYPQATCTCAHSRSPLGTHLTVTYRGRSVVCRNNDVSPFQWTHADIVLSYGAARVLGLEIMANTAEVSIRRMGRLE